jgi:hypothetical protein
MTTGAVSKAACLLRRAHGERTEFMLLSGWESMDAVRAVAGEDIERVVPSPEDARFLVQFDAAAVHYEVVDVCPKEPMT